MFYLKITKSTAISPNIGAKLNYIYENSVSLHLNQISSQGQIAFVLRSEPQLSHIRLTIMRENTSGKMNPFSTELIRLTGSSSYQPSSPN